MGSLIQLIIYIVVFAIIAYGGWWICKYYELPKPVLWIVGAILLIVLLMFAATRLGVPSGFTLH